MYISHHEERFEFIVDSVFQYDSQFQEVFGDREDMWIDFNITQNFDFKSDFQFQQVFGELVNLNLL